MKLYPWTKKQLCCLAHWRQVAIFPKKAATWRRSCFAGSSPQNSPNFSKISTRSKKPNSKRKSWHCCKMNPTKLCGKKWWIWWRKFRGIWWTMKEIICGRNSWNFCSTWPVHLMRIIKKRLYCSLGKIFEFSRLFLLFWQQQLFLTRDDPTCSKCHRYEFTNSLIFFTVRCQLYLAMNKRNTST